MSQSHAETQKQSAINRAPGLPRWVKISGIVIIALVILFAIMHLSGGHGPSSHMSSGDHTDQTMPGAEQTP